MRKLSEPFQFYFLSVLLIFFYSCSPQTNDPFEQAGFNAFDNNMNKRIESYYDATQVQTFEKLGDTTKVYIDFSNGLIQAYKGNPDNAAMLEKITQKLTGSDIKWFGLGKGIVYPLDFPTTQIFNKVTDPKSYATQMMAPIEVAIKEITSANNDALLVTDFEEYSTDGKEQFENFEKGYFIDWLTKGNSIDFFVTNYQEKTLDKRTVDKHLYFIVFNYGSQKKLLADINYSLKDRGFKFETFSLSTDFYTLINEYASEKKGGNYYDKNGIDIVSSLDENQYLNGLKKSNKYFEFYAFQQPWNDIYTNSKSLTEAGVPDPFTDFFRKLYLDASKDDVFKLNGLEVKVSDITDDFTFFSKTQEVKNHKPKLAKDASGNSVFAANETDLIALSCYDTKGNLLPEWNYKSKEITLNNEVFELNVELYNNGFKDSKDKIEIGTKYHTNFNGSQITNPNGLLRVDIVIADCNPNFEKLNLFKWESVTIKGKQNESLAEAIRNTLDKVNPKGKVIYSYFIKAANQ
jgi:hypothetical protein